MAQKTKSRRKKSDLPPFSPVVRLAIPNKGRIAAPILDLVEKSGLHLPEAGERRLITKTLDPHVEILFARPVDIPEYVATGAADLGITGHDMVIERQSDVEELPRSPVREGKTCPGCSRGFSNNIGKATCRDEGRDRISRSSQRHTSPDTR